MNNRVIFLCPDGVISTMRDAVDLEAIKCLNVLVQQSGAAIVMGAVWGIAPTQPETLKMLRSNGFCGNLHTEWNTGGRLTTSDSVADWVARHRELDSHVILSDRKGFRRNQPHVLTSYRNGLTPREVALAMRFLCTSTSQETQVSPLHAYYQTLRK